MKLIVSSGKTMFVNAEQVKMFRISEEKSLSRNYGCDYWIYADDKEIACFDKMEDAKKVLKSITDALTSPLSGDVVLHLGDVE